MDKKETLQDLRSYAAKLRTKIKVSLHKDHFFDAEKYERKLEIVEQDIMVINNGEI